MKIESGPKGEIIIYDIDFPINFSETKGEKLNISYTMQGSGCNIGYDKSIYTIGRMDNRSICLFLLIKNFLEESPVFNKSLFETSGEPMLSAEMDSVAISMIHQERMRQIKKEGYSLSHDDGHDKGELAMAAACYALPKQLRPKDHMVKQPMIWPFEDIYWKPGEDRIKELKKAGALIVAEISRLLRKDGKADKL